MAHRTQGGTSLYLCLLIDCKGCKWTARWRGTLGEVQKDSEHRNLCPGGVGGLPPFWHTEAFTNKKVSELCCLGCLWRFHYVGMIGHWLLTPSLASLPFLRPRGGAERSHPLIAPLVPLVTGPPLLNAIEVPTKSHLISIDSGVFEKGLLWITKDASLTQDIPRVLESLVPGNVE